MQNRPNIKPVASQQPARQPVAVRAPATKAQSTIQSAQPYEIILQVRSHVGLNRITMISEQTINDLLNKVANTVGQPVEALVVDLEGKSVHTMPLSTKVRSIPGAEDGSFVNVKMNPKYQPKQMEVEPSKPVIRNAKGEIVPEEKLRKLEHTLATQPKQPGHILTQFCNHGPTARCVNCLGEQPKQDKPAEETSNKCNHGPYGKCLNCAPVTKEELKQNKPSKLLCQHGPNGKCSHCLDADQITNIKHMSFDSYLSEAMLKCKGQHPAEAKCNNCLPPTSVTYKVKRDCKNHAPWPAAMCNACLPPSVVLKRQPYRHVDYVEFLNIPEIGNLVQYWSSKGKTEQRVGFLYGYYAEDINYKGGVRAVVEAIYEPPQKGHMGSIEFENDNFENDVNNIAGLMGLERIGWIFTTINHDTFLTSQEIRQAAKFQQEFKVKHDSGCEVSKHLTVVLRPKKDNPEEVIPEVYMVSDQFQQLEKDDVFTDSQRRKVLQVRKAVDSSDIVPNFIYDGKSVSEFEPDFFIVNVAHGYNPSSSYNIIKLYDFPVENRSVKTKTSDVKQYMIKHAKKPTYVRFSNFHLLLFLSKLIDQDTVAIIAQCVGQDLEISQEIVDVVKMYSDQS